MAGLAHLGVGMAAKRVAPDLPVGVLVTAAYGIDVVWGAFWAAGLERFPAEGIASVAPWSHGLLMSVVWSVAAGLITMLVTRKRRASVLIGLLVFSHWVVDFIAKPMTHAFPSDSGLPLLFAGSPTVGLGVWGTAAGEYIGEYGTAVLGILVYILSRVRPIKQERGAL